MKKLFKIVLVLFLLGFIYHLSALLVEFSFNLVKSDAHSWTHVGSVVVSAIIDTLLEPPSS